MEKTCECGSTNILTCEECGVVFCMPCFRRFQWLAHSYLCWECASIALSEWFSTAYIHHGKTMPRTRARNYVTAS